MPPGRDNDEEEHPNVVNIKGRVLLSIVLRLIAITRDHAIRILLI